MSNPADPAGILPSIIPGMPQMPDLGPVTVTPPGLAPQAKIAQALAAFGKMAQGAGTAMGGGQEQPAGVATPARPGSVIPGVQPMPTVSGAGGVMPSAMPGGPLVSAASAGAAPMSAAQAGGPMARTAGGPGPTNQLEFRTKQGRNAAIAQNAMASLTQIVHEAKQMKFEKEAAQAGIITSAQMAVAKGKAGGLTDQDVQAIKEMSEQKGDKKSPTIMAAGQAAIQKAQQAGLSQQEIQNIQASGKIKNADKIMEKAMTDPMSGAYVGTQRAYDASQKQAQTQLENEEKLAKIQSDIANKQALEEYRKQMAAAAQQNADTKENKVSMEERLKQQSLIAKNYQHGIMTEFDKDGKMTERPFTAEEIKNSPTLSLQKSVSDARVAKLQADVKKEAMDMVSNRIKANASMLRAQKYQPGQAKPSAFQQKAQMLSGMATDYLNDMKSIIQRRPDLFGPSGWFQSKLEMSAADGDTDARQLIKLGHAASLPIAGIHNMRNQKVTTDISDDLSKNWQSQDAALEGLKPYYDTAQKVIEGGYAGEAGKPGGGKPDKPGGGMKINPDGSIEFN